jgi:hypothetical protein
MRGWAIPHGDFTPRAPIRRAATPEGSVLDILLLGLGVGFFALMADYAAGCERV